MIKPVNGHLIIEPIEHKGFMSSQTDTYQEVGVVIAKDENGLFSTELEVGDKVYFDSWLAAKYPKEGSTTDEFYWLVKWTDVRAIEKVAV